MRTALPVLLFLVMFALSAKAGTEFTYQGQLELSNQSVSAAVDFEFRLFNQKVGGDQIGPALQFEDWPIVDGLFQVNLDFGAGAVGPESRYLEVTVNQTTLSPRQAIRPAPVALFALAGNEGPQGPQGETGPQGPEGPAGDSHWQISGSDTFYTAGAVGVGTSSPDPGYAMHVVPVDTQYLGLYAETPVSFGIGVSGQATATSGFTYGVMGESYSTDGIGVFGSAWATSGGNIGVLGRTSSD